MCFVAWDWLQLNPLSQRKNRNKNQSEPQAKPLHPENRQAQLNLKSLKKQKFPSPGKRTPAKQKLATQGVVANDNP
jgi:hypothetical protein